MAAHLGRGLQDLKGKYTAQTESEPQAEVLALNQRKSSQEASANDGLLLEIERAISEKMERGHADEARWGFAAELANAVPPVDASFQRSLRLRLQTVSASQNVESMSARRGPTPAVLRAPAAI